MAQINITIPDEQAQRVLNRLAEAFHYENAAEGVTKAQHVKNVIINMLRNTVHKQERDNAARDLQPSDPGLE